MTATTELPGRSSPVHGLRRIRVFYTGGTLLWAASAAWTGWLYPGSRQMWVSLLLLAVFGGLLATTSVWLSGAVRSRSAARRSRPARPRPTATARHV
ncbi:hypothetical protein OKJ48_10295 [Streptomyces kunmingensis]|uniref:Integral membrane protein n=1 Tax=Streptomyces kunmingensis TaxID=68225 RepID=A0ABU6C8F8_9ACTN|nr:hypothetical protein [Streptomyces kunmingensis]